MPAEYYIATRERSKIMPFAKSLIPEYNGSSVIWTKAQELIEEGADGLAMVERRIDAVDRFSQTVRDAFLKRNSMVKKSLELNQAAIITGVSLHSIEDMLINARFSESGFVREYHFSVGRSPLALNLWTENPESVDLDQETNSQLLALAEQDKTLATFFSPKALQILPSGIHRLLRESGVLDRIRLSILPAYQNKEDLIKSQTI